MGTVQLTVGGVAATAVTVLSDTELLATIPARASAAGAGVQKVDVVLTRGSARDVGLGAWACVDQLCIMHRRVPMHVHARMGTEHIYYSIICWVSVIRPSAV